MPADETGPDTAAAGAPPELLVITGTSGAGRSTAANILEDVGWYVVYNLPPQLIDSLVRLTEEARPTLRRTAVVVHIRTRAFFAELQSALRELRSRGMPARVIFLDASDEVLVRRFESTRRPHPLQGDGAILEGIRLERALLEELRGLADTVLDSSRFNVHQLASVVAGLFGDPTTPDLRLTVMSFGFKYGLPLDADNVVDVRFLPNPHWVPELRPRTGQDGPVRDFVLAQQGATEFLDRYLAALEPALAGYVRENKRFVTLAVGCTGGKHRSVAIAEHLAARLAAPQVKVTVAHRDLGRE